MFRIPSFRMVSIRNKIIISNITMFLFVFSICGAAITLVIKISFEKNAEAELAKTNKIIVSMIQTDINNNIQTHLTTLANQTKGAIQSEYNRYLRGEISEKEARAFCRSLILDTNYSKIGSTGYMAGVTNKGILTIHPYSEGTDASRYPFMQKAIKMKNGFMEYEWQNSDELSPRKKVGGFAYFGPWNLLIWASAYKSEFTDLVRHADYCKMIASIKFDKSGYTYVLNTKGDLIVHPEREGQNAYNFQDSHGTRFVQIMCKTKSGQFNYYWKNSTDKHPRKKVIVYNYIPYVDWIIASSAYYDEINGWVYTLIRVLLIIFIIAVALSLILSYYIAETFSRPIKMLQNLFHRIEEGDYTVRGSEIPQNEFGQLVLGFNAMAETLQQNCTDITNYLNLLTKEKNTLEERVAARTADLEEINLKLQKMDRLKSDFISTVSHELRTPLTSVLGFSRMISKKLDEVVFPEIVSPNPKVAKNIDQVRSNIAIITAEGERLTTLINEVLDIAKMESGKMEWHIETVSLPEILEHARAAVFSLYASKHIALTLEIPPEINTITADSNRLIQVMINLFSNAVKFTEQGEVKCKVETTEHDSLRVLVSDSGIGIAKENLSSVFDKFTQIGDTLTDKPQGTGLGLPICKEIIEHHGGAIWVESELGKGSTFIFEIPADPAPQQEYMI